MLCTQASEYKSKQIHTGASNSSMTDHTVLRKHHAQLQVSDCRYCSKHNPCCLSKLNRLGGPIQNSMCGTSLIDVTCGKRANGRGKAKQAGTKPSGKGEGGQTRQQASNGQANSSHAAKVRSVSKHKTCSENCNVVESSAKPSWFNHAHHRILCTFCVSGGAGLHITEIWKGHQQTTTF